MSEKIKIYFAVVEFTQDDEVTISREIDVDEESLECDEYYALLVKEEDLWDTDIEFIDSEEYKLQKEREDEEEYRAFLYMKFDSLEYAIWHLDDTIEVIGYDFSYLKSKNGAPSIWHSNPTVYQPIKISSNEDLEWFYEIVEDMEKRYGQPLEKFVEEMQKKDNDKKKEI